MTYLEILELMEEMIDNATAVPISSKKLIDCTQMRDYIESLRHTIPDDVEAAKKVIDTKDQIIADANKEAEDIRKKSDKAVEAAKAKAVEIMSQTEITKMAKKHAVEIINEAQAEADRIVSEAKSKDLEIRRMLSDSVNKTLFDAKSILEKNLSDITTTINQVESLNPKPVEAAEAAEEKAE